MNRRKFIAGGLAGAAAMAGPGAMLPVLDGVARAAKRQTPQLRGFIAVWRGADNAGLIPWNAPSPRRVAEAFSHLVWAYFQNPERFNLFMNRNKATIIGHTSLLIEMQFADGEQRKLLFSNSGKLDRGVYRNPALIGPGSSEGFPRRPPYTFNCECVVPASIRLNEVMAGHNESGFWEDFKKYEKRVRERKRPAMRRFTVTGNEAIRTFELLSAAKEAAQPREGVYGAPLHFGLNGRVVRLPGQFDKPVPPTRHAIGGRRVAIPSGCSNAIAAVLEAARLGHLVPRGRAVFRRPIDLARFAESELPVIVQRNAFDASGRALNAVLNEELDKLPASWGSGEVLEFADPNHWHATLPLAAEGDLADFHALVGLH